MIGGDVQPLPAMRPQPTLPPPGSSDAALQQAEEFIEEEEGAANKHRGWLHGFVLTRRGRDVAVPPLRRLRDRADQMLRPVHVELRAVPRASWSSRWRRAFATGSMWWDWLAAAAAIATIGLPDPGRRRLHRPQHLAEPARHRVRHRADRPRAGGDAAHQRLDHAGDRLGVPRLRLFGPYLPAALDAKGYEVGRLVGVLYMTLEGIYGVAVDVSSSLIILFTIFGAFLQYSGAGKFYIDFSFSAMGGKRDRRGPDGRAGVVPAGRAVGLGRGDHRDARRRGLPDARQGGLREERGRRAARRRRAGRHHLAAGARRGGVPHRRVPQDLLSRRAC